MIRVGIADDHSIVRAALRQYVEEQRDMRVVGEASHGRAAIDLVRQTPMDVLTLDLSMPGHSGLDAIGMIRAKAPRVAILVLSGHTVASYALKLFRLGARGYLNKQCEPQEIVQAVRTVAAGRQFIQPEMAQLLAQQIDKSPADTPHDSLSDKEFQVFIKLAMGERSAQIAQETSISHKTVSSYRTKLMDKLGLQTNSDLTHYALRNRLIE
ncbi:MAG: response regulator transcription factor [Haliea sp.]|nr:MAG: response regulator transcription factor [Haliea sp.]